MMNGYGMIGYMHTMTPLMWVFMVLLWGFAIFGLIYAVRWLVDHSRNDKHHHE